MATDYNVRSLDEEGRVQYDVHAPSLAAAVEKFKELTEPPVVDTHEGEQTLFESVGEPDPIEP